MTLEVLVGSVGLGSVVALVFGLARVSAKKWVRGIALVYIEVFRGISAIILMFFMFFALPILFGVPSMPPELSGILALGLIMGAFGAEVVRGAIEAVPRGQTDASISLNLSNVQRYRYVVLPLAVPIVLPPYGNAVIEVLKGTALVSLITLADLAREAQVIRQNITVSPNPVSTAVLYLNVLVMYLILAQLIALAFRKLELRSERRFRRQ